MLISREMVLDQDIGLNATLFGGDMMARMDKVAGITASLMSRNRRFLTLKVSELVFHSPVRAGEIIEFYVAVARPGHTSMTLQIEVQVYSRCPMPGGTSPAANSSWWPWTKGSTLSPSSGSPRPSRPRRRPTEARTQPGLKARILMA